MSGDKAIKVLAGKLKEEMKINEDKTIITISEKAIEAALKEEGFDLKTINKVNAATKNIFTASLEAAGELVVDEVFSDENIDSNHTTVFHMNQYATDSFTHAFTKNAENELEIYSVYKQELEGDTYKRISDELKQRFKVSF